MTYGCYHNQRWVAALLCLYMALLNGLTMGNPPDVDASENSISPPTDLEHYAQDPACYQNVETLLSLYNQSEEVYMDLTVVSVEMSRNRHLPDFREAELERCNELMNHINGVIIVTGEYAWLKRIFDEYHKLNRELTSCKDPQLLPRLSQEMHDLRQLFNGRHKLALDALNEEMIGDYTTKIENARAFIKKHKPSVQAPPPASVPGSEGVVEEVRDVLNGDQVTTPTDDANGNAEADEPNMFGMGFKSDAYFRCLQLSPNRLLTLQCLKDRSISARLEILQSVAQTIKNDLRDPSMKEACITALFTKRYPNEKEITEDFRRGFDASLKHFRHFNDAWKLHTRYNEVTDSLQTMDIKSPQADELRKEEQRIILEFDQYAPYITVGPCVSMIEERILELLHLLHKVKEEKKSPSSSPVSPDATPASMIPPFSNATIDSDTVGLGSRATSGPTASEETVSAPSNQRPRTVPSEAHREAATPTLVPSSRQTAAEATSTSGSAPIPASTKEPVSKQTSGPTTAPPAAVVPAPTLLTAPTSASRQTSGPTTAPPAAAVPAPTLPTAPTSASRQASGPTSTPKPRLVPSQTAKAPSSPTTAPTTISTPAPAPETISKLAATGEGDASSDAFKGKIIESVLNNIRSASNKKKPSGHLVMGMTAIKTLVALYLMAML